MLDEARVKVACGDPDTPGLVLLTIALWAFGDQVFGSDEVEPFDAAELWAAFQERFGVWLPEENENRLNALMLAVSTDNFYHDPIVFAAVSNSLIEGDLGDMIDGIWDDPTYPEMLWAVLEVELARDEEQGPPELGPAVRRAIDEAVAGDQEDQSEAQAFVESLYRDLTQRLRYIGVSPDAIRIYDAEYDETMDALME